MKRQIIKDELFEREAYENDEAYGRAIRGGGWDFLKKGIHLDYNRNDWDPESFGVIISDDDKMVFTFRVVRNK